MITIYLSAFIAMFSSKPLPPEGPLKTYSYTWSYWNDHGSGWGENTITLGHYPTRRDISKHMQKCIGRPLGREYDVDIFEVKDEKELYQRPIMDRLPGLHKSKLGL